MHIINPQSSLLSNHEVLLHVRAVDAEYTGEDSTSRARTKPPGLKNMLQDTIQYLTSADQNSALAAMAEGHAERPMTLYKGPHSLFRRLAEKYTLNKAEYLQIYNLRPASLIVLCLIIEEWDTRFSEEQMEEMVRDIAAVFDEEEGDIPTGVEDVQMERIGNKLLGAKKRRKGGAAAGKRRAAA
ncbi:hypothetical protein BU24DRAFT_459753 [Aaosphaeria arxii CBS 175.79]|uniref:DNA-directed RNA polymerase III subunit RPC9 n=1 Tax=Aaosphaeria arxii CBS 175.79 TaxID=1450172 RepID=A0A6A5Y3L8_9PLEO|nr:uncharacterized protein BU24DRAFT_459753 [Aaosphaeria arxii CBS 175.79]KAF2020145.1 hypothetical protein BU24DRAFT_459753 [Aaosphaeria arxii CBS 175.79]